MTFANAGTGTVPMCASRVCAEAQLEDFGSGLTPVTEAGSSSTFATPSGGSRTEHAFVGAGEGPCVILMVGSRVGPGVRYPVSQLGARYGASVAEETSDWRQAYATVERFRRERPPSWARLPWA